MPQGQASFSLNGCNGPDKSGGIDLFAGKFNDRIGIRWAAPHRPVRVGNGASSTDPCRWQQLLLTNGEHAAGPDSIGEAYASLALQGA